MGRIQSTCAFTRAATETKMAIVDTAMSKEPMMSVPDLRLVQPQHFLLPSGRVIPSIICCSTNSQNCRIWWKKGLSTTAAAAEKKRETAFLEDCVRSADATKLFWGKVKQRAALKLTCLLNCEINNLTEYPLSCMCDFFHSNMIMKSKAFLRPFKLKTIFFYGLLNKSEFEQENDACP